MAVVGWDGDPASPNRHRGRVCVLIPRKSGWVTSTLGESWLPCYELTT